MIVTIYLIGCFIAYIIINTVAKNSYKEKKGANGLVYTSIIVYSFSSWFTVVIFSLMFLLDSRLRKLTKPLHFKIY